VVSKEPHLKILLKYYLKILKITVPLGARRRTETEGYKLNGICMPFDNSKGIFVFYRLLPTVNKQGKVEVMDIHGLKIGIIGLGSVGRALAHILKTKRFNLQGVYSRIFQNAEELAKVLDCNAYQTPWDLAKDCQVIIIATSDKAIGEVCNLLVEKKALSIGQYLVHLSGSLTTEVLESASEIGCFSLSMHPLQSFANVEEALLNLPQSYFALEGDPEAVNIAQGIIKDIGGVPIQISKEVKPLYHAAACMASNYLVSLINMSKELLVKANFTEEEAIQAIMPLIKGTVRNIEQLGTVKALTGPIARGDTKTINKHLEVLKDNNLLNLYKMIGIYTTDIAMKRSNHYQEDLVIIRKLLMDGVCHD
jgi:predicted short-subunit dehydrogenase-like oxidoreductase (DUF2520 family)